MHYSYYVHTCTVSDDGTTRTSFSPRVFFFSDENAIIYQDVDRLGISRNSKYFFYVHVEPKAFFLLFPAVVCPFKQFFIHSTKETP